MKGINGIIKPNRFHRDFRVTQSTPAVGAPHLHLHVQKLIDLYTDNTKNALQFIHTRTHSHTHTHAGSRTCTAELRAEILFGA